MYRDGIEGVTTVEAAETHPEVPDVVTLGECLTQAYHSDWQGPDTIRSQVVLYYGSFRQAAHDDPDFHWEEQLQETIVLLRMIRRIHRPPILLPTGAPRRTAAEEGAADGSA